MDIPFADLSTENTRLEHQLITALQRINATGNYILGDCVQQFENEVCNMTGAKHAVAVNSGTDALFLSLKALGIGTGDEVITVANSFVATAGAIAATGAKPVFVDVTQDLTIDPDNIAEKITPQTKAILPVHLTGKPADMTKIIQVAQQYQLAIVEDAAQALGAAHCQQAVGTFGDFGCFSLHPFKVLAGLGDGGIIVTNKQDHYEKLLALRNHGIHQGAIQQWGYNSRLDTIQAAWLLEKLPGFAKHTERRQVIANYYTARFNGKIDCPKVAANERCVFQTYIIKVPQRQQVMARLKQQGIETAVHYPNPIHLQPVGRALGYKEQDLPVTEALSKTILSLPIYPTLSDDQLAFVADNVLQFG